MQFRTQIPIPNSDSPISYNSHVVSLGSCFAVNIAEKLSYFKFSNVVNPFGILFHPLALEKFVALACGVRLIAENDLVFQNERWHCFDAHSDISHPDKTTLINNLNDIIQLANGEISKASHIIVTLGTAWVYRHKESGNLVANCHKVPQKFFEKELLSPDQIEAGITSMAAMLKTANHSVRIIYTISPVRHIKDGFVENQRSKANLIAGLHQVLAKTPAAHYFPSYEIMMDELRDYRFYAEDMLHPNQIAIDYIWQRFSETWLSDDVLPTVHEVGQIMKSMLHKPFNPESAQHKEFLLKLKNRIALIREKFPQITF